MFTRGLKNSISIFLYLAACLWLVTLPTANARSDDNPVYRIQILDGKSLKDAQLLKDTLEGLDYSPVTIDRDAGGYRVLYGHFSSENMAREALLDLGREGFSGSVVISSQSEALISHPPNEGSYYVMVRRFLDRSKARKLEQKLIGENFATVSIKHVGAYFELQIGNFKIEDATVVLGKLRRLGFGATASVSRVFIGRHSEAGDGIRNPEATPSIQPSEVVSPIIANSALWNDLTMSQQKDVIQTVMMSQELRGGNILAQQVIDIDERLENVDDKIKSVIGMIEEDHQLSRQIRGTIDEKYKQADRKISAKEYQQAIVLLKEIQLLDKGNQFGQKEHINRRVDWLMNKMAGRNYDGEDEVITHKRKKLEGEARMLATKAGSGDPMLMIETLRRARGKWDQIKFLDPVNYGPTADSEITELDKRIQQLETSRLSMIKPSGDHWRMMYGALGAAALLFVLFILVWIRGSRLKREQVALMNTLTEFTGSMRPMRGLAEGGTPAMLVDTGSETGGGGTAQGESEIFTPQAMTSSVDPLGGVLNKSDSSLDETMGGEIPGSTSDAVDASNETVFREILGKDDGNHDAGSDRSGESPVTEDSGGDLNLDKLFGGGDVLTSGDSTGGGLEDPSVVMDDLFTGNDNSIVSKKAAVELAPGDLLQEGASDGQALVDSISFGDIGDGPEAVEDETACDQGSEANVSGNNEDLLALFDSMIGEETTDTEVDGRVGDVVSSANSTDESQFTSILDEQAPDTRVAKMSPPGDEELDDGEIPSIQLDMGGGSDLGAKTALHLDAIDASETHEMGDSNQGLKYDSMTEQEPGEVKGGVELAFEDDQLGQHPTGWEGDYEYASLTVESATPSKGSNQYLCFQKREGRGKALYSYRFSEVSGGKVEIRFDLCCSEKNKFLLGFYIENQSDPKQSIHTKILLSEAQTTPTIHMHGESAPYLLGSWANIRYVIDLDEAKVDGYIDNTHVARDLPLQPNPGRFDTLSIRDNINATGVLLLNNIRVRPMA